MQSSSPRSDATFSAVTNLPSVSASRFGNANSQSSTTCSSGFPIGRSLEPGIGIRTARFTTGAATTAQLLIDGDRDTYPGLPQRHGDRGAPDTPPEVRWPHFRESILESRRILQELTAAGHFEPRRRPWSQGGGTLEWWGTRDRLWSEDDSDSSDGCFLTDAEYAYNLRALNLRDILRNWRDFQMLTYLRHGR